MRTQHAFPPDYALSVSPPHRATTLIFCPLKVEATAISRELRRLQSPIRAVITTGTASNTIRQLAHEKARDTHASPPLFLLAGLAGGLCPCDAVPTVTRVIDSGGHSWNLSPSDTSGVTLLGVPSPISSSFEK